MKLHKVAVLLFTMLLVPFAACNIEIPPPVHLSVIALDASTGIVHLAKQWFIDAQTKPRSTFTVYKPGATRSELELQAVLEIPDAWGSGVQKRISNYWTDAEAILASGSGRLPPDSSPPTTDTAGVFEAIVLDGAGVEHHLAPPAQLKTYVIICDRSGSVSLVDCCSRETLLGAYDLFQEGAAPKSRMTIYSTGQGRHDTEVIFSVVVPDRARGELASYLFGARAELAAIDLDLAIPRPGSAVPDALDIASESFNLNDASKDLWVMSDLRSVDSTFNFERDIPDPQVFIETMRNEGLHPDLGGVHVHVVGVHHHGDFDALMDANLRTTWSAFFDAAGASDIAMYSSAIVSPLATTN